MTSNNVGREPSVVETAGEFLRGWGGDAAVRAAFGAAQRLLQATVCEATPTATGHPLRGPMPRRAVISVLFGLGFLEHVWGFALASVC